MEPSNLPPIFSFEPYVPARTTTVRAAREAMWLVQTQKPARKPRDASKTKPSPRAKRQTVQLPPGLDPVAQEIFLAALRGIK